jgi:hypothetical protein
MMLSSANTANLDRRRGTRQTCSLEALVLPGLRACTVVDRSGGGLRLRFRQPYDGPSSLTVVLIEAGLCLTANAKWTRDGEVGAIVTGQCDLNGLVPGAFAEARQAWRRFKGTDRPYYQGSNDP